MSKDMPPLEIPFHSGVRAFVEPIFKGGTLPVNTNPYPKDSMLYKEWERGYNTAYFRALKKAQKFSDSH